MYPAEIIYLIEGYERRYNRLEDLFINWIAYPYAQVNCGKKCPPKEDFFKHRNRNKEKVDHAAIAERIAEEFGI